MKSKVGTKKYYLKMLDKEFGKYVHRGDECARCYKKTILQCHHIVTRGNMTLRHDPMNGMLLCVPCHEYARDHNKKFKAWLKENWPERYEYLMFNKNEIDRSTAHDLKELYEWYKEKNKEH